MKSGLQWDCSGRGYLSSYKAVANIVTSYGVYYSNSYDNNNDNRGTMSVRE